MGQRISVCRIKEMEGDIVKKYRFIMLSFFFSVLFHFGIQQLDNKYTYNDVEAACGVVDYGNSAQDMHFLTRQWEFYHGQLLTPEMIAENQARLTRYIDIGQFGGFELGDQTQSPHGQATYRLRIFDKANQVRTMQLPEIYSAYKLYVNGVLLYQSGEVAKESYEPEILSTDITFTTKECNELILQVSDYSHYYSGMIYPIAYGKNQKVNIYETIQILTKGLQSFLPLVMGIICLITYLFAGRDKRDGYFVLVCISYLSYILYAMIHMLMANRSFVWYRIEDLSYYLLIYFVLLLVVQQYQYRIPKGWAFTGAVVMAATLLVPTFFITQNADVIYLISRIGRFYKQLFSIIMMYVILKSRNGQGEDSFERLPDWLYFLSWV